MHMQLRAYASSHHSVHSGGDSRKHDERRIQERRQREVDRQIDAIWNPVLRSVREAATDELTRADGFADAAEKTHVEEAGTKISGRTKGRKFRRQLIVESTRGAGNAVITVPDEGGHVADVLALACSTLSEPLPRSRGLGREVITSHMVSTLSEADIKTGAHTHLTRPAKHSSCACVLM